MVKCDPRRGKYMACCLLFRGDEEVGADSADIEEGEGEEY